MGFELITAHSVHRFGSLASETEESNIKRIQLVSKKMIVSDQKRSRSRSDSPTHTAILTAKLFCLFALVLCDISNQDWKDFSFPSSSLFRRSVHKGYLLVLISWLPLSRWEGSKEKRRRIFPEFPSGNEQKRNCCPIPGLIFPSVGLIISLCNEGRKANDASSCLMEWWHNSWHVLLGFL